MDERIRVGFTETKAIATTGEFEGYGSIFGNADLQKDVVHPGAFRETLRKSAAGEESWPKMFYEHDQSNPIGEWTDVREDSKGLLVQGKLWIDGAHPDLWAMKAYRSMSSTRGQHGLSIGYSVVQADIDHAKKVRNLRELRLREISPVTMPANPKATVTAVKSITSLRQFESALRELGFSRREAEAVAEAGFKGLERVTREEWGETEDKALPVPATTEDHQTFMERCMVDPGMAGKFPDHHERADACTARAAGKSVGGDQAARDELGEVDWSCVLSTIVDGRKGINLT